MAIARPEMGAHVSLRGHRSSDYSWATLPVCVVIKSSSLSWGGSAASMGTAADDRAPWPPTSRAPWPGQPPPPFCCLLVSPFLLLITLSSSSSSSTLSIGTILAVWSVCLQCPVGGEWRAMLIPSPPLPTSHALSMVCPIKHQVLPSCLLDPFQQFVISNKLWFPIPTIWYSIISTWILVTAGTFPRYQGNLCSFPTIQNSHSLVKDRSSAESEKSRQRVSNADRKVFVNPESFCDKFIIRWRISGYFVALQIIQIICKEISKMCPDNVKRVWMISKCAGVIWKVSGRS